VLIKPSTIPRLPRPSARTLVTGFLGKRMSMCLTVPRVWGCTAASGGGAGMLPRYRSSSGTMSSDGRLPTSVTWYCDGSAKHCHAKGKGRGPHVRSLHRMGYVVTHGRCF
jgi:hypothetical protein